MNILRYNATLSKWLVPLDFFSQTPFPYVKKNVMKHKELIDSFFMVIRINLWFHCVSIYGVN